MNESPTQDMDTGKEPEDELNPMRNLTIVNSPSTQTTPSSKEPSSAPPWLEAFIGKKCSVVPITIPMEDMVSKCLGKVSKPKKLEVDEATGHWTTEIAKPIPGRDSDKATEDDFIVKKIDLGVASRAVDVKHLESSTKRMISRSWKDEKDKKELKQIINQMVEYINPMHHPSPQTLSQVAVSFDPNSLANQKMLHQVQRNRIVAEMFNKWLDLIIQQGSDYIVSMVKVYEDVVTVRKELELEVVAWEKERTKWVVVLVQMNDVQKFGVMKFLVEKPVESLDDNE